MPLYESQRAVCVRDHDRGGLVWASSEDLQENPRRPVLDEPVEAHEKSNINDRLHLVRKIARLVRRTAARVQTSSLGGVPIRLRHQKTHEHRVRSRRPVNELRDRRCEEQIGPAAVHCECE